MFWCGYEIKDYNIKVRNINSLKVILCILILNPVGLDTC